MQKIYSVLRCALKHFHCNRENSREFEFSTTKLSVLGCPFKKLKITKVVYVLIHYILYCNNINISLLQQR